MPVITFIYKIGKNPTTYYGKYITDYLSDDHDGLDREVRPILVKVLNEYRKKKGYWLLNSKQIKIGIISLYNDYSSKRETKCFDFYHITGNYLMNKEPSISYINGQKIEIPTVDIF